ncbi:MAG: RnfABCDGE type electron transport complex subunit D [Dehalococcoidia bacterium]|nr:RnfABCDGE type electron transport complex subunit D [Dehalococcoidia bacterium]
MTIAASPRTTLPIVRFFRTPKGVLLLVLALFALLAMPLQGVRQVAPGLLGATAAAALADIAIVRLRRQAWIFPSGAILTGVIIALVLRPDESWYVPIAASLLAIGSKHLFRTRWANIFNPAALALVVSSLLFASAQSWWGALPDLGPIGVVILLATGVFVADRINKLPLVLAFLGAYFLLFTATSFVMEPGRVAEVFRTPDLQAVLFFAFIMVDDPPTSPVRYGGQIFFGIIVAVVAHFVLMTNGAVYFMLVGLLVANAWEACRRVLLQGKKDKVPGL